MSEAVVDADVAEIEQIGAHVEGVALDVVGHIGGTQPQVHGGHGIAHDIDVVERADDADGTSNKARHFLEHATEESVDESGVGVVGVHIQLYVVLGRRNPAIYGCDACHVAYPARESVWHLVEVNNSPVHADTFHLLIPMGGDVGIAEWPFLNGKVFHIEAGSHVWRTSAQHVVYHHVA